MRKLLIFILLVGLLFISCSPTYSNKINMTTSALNPVKPLADFNIISVYYDFEDIIFKEALIKIGEAFPENVGIYYRSDHIFYVIVSNKNKGEK
jgi:hypothetical protein